MPIFQTQGNVYIANQVGEFVAFRIPRGERAGQLYGLLGCYDPGKYSLELTMVKDHVIFNGREVPLDRLSDLLEQEVTVGSRIVARRIMEPEMKRFYEPDEEGYGVMVTSRVKKVGA